MRLKNVSPAGIHKYVQAARARDDLTEEARQMMDDKIAAAIAEINADPLLPIIDRKMAEAREQIVRDLKEEMRRIITRRE